MRILLISTVFPPQNAPASPRLAGFAQAWSGAGEELTVLTTPKREDHRGYEHTTDGYEVVEVPYPVPALLNRLRARDKSAAAGAAASMAESFNGQADPEAGADRRAGWMRRLRNLRERTGVFGAARMPDLTDFWVRPAAAWAHARFEQENRRPWDFAVSSAGPYTTHLVARRLKRDGLVNLWAADFRDLWTDNEPFTGLFPFTLIERALERSCLREADVLTTISPPLAARLSQRAGKPAEVVYNGFDGHSARSLGGGPAFPPDGRRRLVYTGTLYPAGHEPEPLLRAMAVLRASRGDLAQRLGLVVAGPKGELWRRLAEQHGVADMLELVGEVDRGQALRMQRDADALLVLDWKKPGAGVVTSKLFEYLPARAPIVVVGGASESAIGAILGRTKRGVHLGGDVQAISGFLSTLIENPAALPSAGDAAAIGMFDIRAQARRYLELLRDRTAQYSDHPARRAP